MWGPLRPHPTPPTPPSKPQGHWGTRVYCWPGRFPAPSTCFGIHAPGISGGGFQNNLGIDRGLFPGKAGYDIEKVLDLERTRHGPAKGVGRQPGQEGGLSLRGQ